MQQLKKIKKPAVVLLLSAGMLLSFKAVNDYFEVSKNLDIFAAVYREVNTSYVDEVQAGELARAAIDGMLNSLDPYTVFFSEAQKEDYQYEVTGTYAGIGATIRTVNDQIVIDAPYSGFPAALAGMRVGDRILEIDGVSMDGKSSSEVTDRLKGKSGTEVVIKVDRPGQGIKNFTVKRAQIKRNNVPYASMLDKQVGYIKLTGFTPGAANEVRNSVGRLRSEGAKGLILDLRGNGGGLLHEAVAIVNIFVPKGKTVVVTRGKHKEEDRVYRTLDNPMDLETPLIIMIDERSASASEIVSGALQDLDRGLLIGRNSFGKGLVQGTKSLSYNSQMKITIAKYYLPSGRLIQRLDYGNKVDGQAIAVADSAKQVFYTANKRPVVDGEGIQPDVEVELLPYSKVAQSLIQNNHAFNFAVDYRNANDEVAPAREFNVDDALFSSFIDYLKGKDYAYQTKTEKLLEQLKTSADKDKMIEQISTEIEALEEAISSYKEDDLQHQKVEIMELLEYEIAAAYYLEKGKVESGFDDDPDLLKAYALFNEPTEMTSLLGN